MNKEWRDKTELLHSTLRATATNDTCPTGDYVELRSEFMNNAAIRTLIPDFVIKHRNLDEFWDFIKNKFAHYRERRAYLSEEFSRLYNYFEDAPMVLDNLVSHAVREFDEHYVYELWQKALERRESDPDGAITAARALLEATCKYILDKSSKTNLVRYNEQSDLPQLYKLTSELLNLAPSQHTEQQFKQILSGCVSIVTGLGSVRNKASDAHGRGLSGTKPTARHASFCVNIAGTMATFLIQTWEKRMQQLGEETP